MDIREIIGYISTAIGGGVITQIVNWRINRKKSDIEIQASEVQVISDTVRTVYEPLIERLNNRVQDLDEEVKRLREEKIQMEKNYQNQIAKLEKRILDVSRAIGYKAVERARDLDTGKFIKNDKDQ